MANPEYVSSDLRLTREEREGVTKMLAALRPGVYVKCSQCNRFGHSYTVSFISSQVVCAECGG